jgi:TPR repeat protein
MPPGAIIRARLRAASGRPEARLLLAERLAEHGAGTEAVRHIAAAARDGLPEAQTRLGLCYLHGHGVPASLGEARHWLELAAGAGDATALTQLASLALGGASGPYRRGLFTEPAADNISEPDYTLAASLARRAADAGSAEARALLATILRMDPETEKTRDEADTLYWKSAQSGWPLGQLGHAMTLLRAGTPDATREAQVLLSAAADAGLPTAHFLLGAMAESGVGMQPDIAAAAAHYRAAAERGHAAAKTRLGLALLTGRGTKRSLAEAETWLRRGAHDGDALAAAVLGDFHASRDRRPPNLEEAAVWYRHAAELGHPGSARALAQTMAAGAAGKPDPNEIASWLETAIEGGEAAAWPELGGLIASAALPAEQLPALHGWLRRMIHEDRPEAGYYVGICVNNGIGTPTDYVLARRYYLWAAGEGVIEAMVAAGEMLLNGRGGRADPALARTLFEYAAKRNHAGAAYALGVIAGDDRETAMTHFREAAALGHQKAKLLTASEPLLA